MGHLNMHRCRLASPATSGSVRALVVSLVIAAACAPLPVAAMGHFKCSIIESIQLPFERPGHKDYLTHYTCQVTAGQLDGFVVSESTRWEIDGDEGKLLGSLGIARKGDATVVYETDEGTMRNVRIADTRPTSWDSTALAKIKGASGSAANLSGKTFFMHGRLISPPTFSIDAVLVK